jgi:hypothetical protein
MAVEGNILEAINLCLNVLEKHFMDRDLTRTGTVHYTLYSVLTIRTRTGNSIVMLTAGAGVFRVEPVKLKHFLSASRLRHLSPST